MGWSRRPKDNLLLPEIQLSQLSMFRWAGVEDPKIMITTSRDPSAKLKQFAKV